MANITTIILAAGEGKRMRSSVPKLLHPVAGRPIVGHVVQAAMDAGSDVIAAVTAPNQAVVQDLIRNIAPDAQLFEQAERLGTAHAAQMAKPAWQNAKGYVAVVYGDHPLLHGDIFRQVFERLEQGWDACILGFEPKDPSGYGRFIVEGEHLRDIVEHKDASFEQREIGQCNACILAFQADAFRQTINLVKNDNAQSEYYLTDMVKIANDLGLKVSYVLAPANDVYGVNSRSQLADAEGLFQQRLRTRAM
ncbi:MAG: NTP transferase domain-containing protein, partial [Devosiaceae bacterium]|nr:NTP transferase domain-containing protein [Devosiaceae bacterium]